MPQTVTAPVEPFADICIRTSRRQPNTVTQPKRTQLLPAKEGSFYLFLLLRLKLESFGPASQAIEF
jgi:hypothetical protein